MSKNISALSGRKGLEKNLFEELGVAAAHTGTPDPESMERIRQEFLVGKSTVYGSVSFYDFLRPENQGKKVYVCNGSACLTAGTQDKLHSQISSHFKSEEIGEMCCLGRCHENSAFHINGKNYSGDDINLIESLKKEFKPTQETYYVGSQGAAILTTPYPAVDEYYRILQWALSKSQEELLAELKAEKAK